MDPVVASWIKEFVLRQNIPMNITQGFLDMLPDEPADSESESSIRVRRGVVQRRLAEGLTRRSITHDTLGTIEALYALRPLPAAVDAYRAVAVYLAASAADFPRSISDLCARRIPNLLRSPSTAGLASPSLDAEVRELEQALTDIQLRTGIMTRNSRSKALDAVRALLEAEYQDVGPPILEIVAENVHGDEDQVDAQSGSQAGAGAGDGAGAGAELAGDDVRGDGAEAELAGDDVRGDGAESGSGAETQTPAQVARQQAAQTPPVAAAQNQATQTPPAVAQNQPTQTPSGEKSTAMPPQRKEIHMPPGGIEMPRQPKIDGSRRGKEVNSSKDMEQEPTVRTYEGDGSKAKAVCPPTLVVNKRRKTRRWSVVEEEVLRNGVRELGKGCWKEILKNHSDVFEGRTEVDLKDKWRNMTR